MWQALAPLLAVAGGTFLAAQGNTNAANTVNATTGQVISNIQNATTNQQAIDTSVANTANTTAAPGISYLQQLVANPNTLTPTQQAQLQQNRTSVADTIHDSDFAGSGAAAAQLFKQTDDSFVNDALASNRSAATGAANTLAGNAQTADQALMAAGSAGTSAAESEGNIELQGANIDANAQIANSKLIGQALGDVVSLSTRQNKLSTLGNSSTST